MKTYVRRPPPGVEAVQVTEANRAEIEALLGVRRLQEGHYALGEDIVPPGWWIFRYVGSYELNAVPDEQFRATFEEETP